MIITMTTGIDFIWARVELLHDKRNSSEAAMAANTTCVEFERQIHILYHMQVAVLVGCRGAGPMINETLQTKEI